MKIIYENCGVKKYMKEDHRSYKRNFVSIMLSTTMLALHCLPNVGLQTKSAF